MRWKQSQDDQYRMNHVGDSRLCEVDIKDFHHGEQGPTMQTQNTKNNSAKPNF